MKSPLKHCNAPVLHNPETNKMRSNIASTSGRGTGNEVALKQAANKRKGTLMKKEKYKCGSPMTMVIQSPLNLKLSAGCKAAARKKFDVYPSAYANMWASKQQKKGKC